MVSAALIAAAVLLATAPAGGSGLALAAVAPPALVRVGLQPQRPPGATAVGTLASTTPLALTVTLAPPDPAALARYATEVATPGSPVYRQYLTVAQFRQQFAPTPAQIQTVTASLEAHGLQPGTPSANGLSIPAVATAGTIARAFALSFDRVALPGGRIAYANTQAPGLDAAVAPLIEGVIGLDDLAQAQPLDLGRNAIPANDLGSLLDTMAGGALAGGAQACSAAAAVAALDHSYTANQLASAYGFSSLYSAGDEAQRQTVALVELEPYSPSDIDAYQDCYGTNAPVTAVPVDGGAGAGPGSGEAALDIEDVIGLAPKAAISVYEGPNAGSGLYDTYSDAISQDQASVISTSWGECESQLGSAAATSENTLFEEAAAQGQAVFAAAGDSGSEDCGSGKGKSAAALAVDDPASQPFVTGVGGTTLSTLGPPPVQTVWNAASTVRGCSHGPCGGGAGGGGISSVWPMPA